MDFQGIDTAAEQPASRQLQVRLFWRPGCPYCTRLRRGLARHGVLVEEVNIWADPAAAAAVRAVTGGSETVPTVFGGDRALVNPSVAAVLAAMGATAPLAARRRNRSPVVRGVQWSAVAGWVIASELVSRAGHPELGYVFDGLAFLSYQVIARLGRGVSRRVGQP